MNAGPPAERGARERFLIINSGRTGSSLLCAILADAGADFGMPAEQSWSAGDGAFELASITSAAAWLTAASQLAATKPPWPRSWQWSFARHRAKRHLREAAAAARFLKGPNLDLAVQPIVKLGYLPRIIVSYRSFTAQAMSLAQRSAHRDATALEAYYLRTYKNALMWLLVFGGVVVDYDEVIDLQQTEWAAALAELTGLPLPRIIAARQARLDASGATAAGLPALSSECERLYHSLREFSGRVMVPSRLAARSPAHRLAAPQAA